MNMRWITPTNLFSELVTRLTLTRLPFTGIPPLKNRRHEVLPASGPQKTELSAQQGANPKSEADFTGTTIEVAQLDAKEKKTLVLYLTQAGYPSHEIVLWHCASPSLKRAARLRALDPLHLLQRVETQSQWLNQACTACLSCAQKVA